MAQRQVQLASYSPQPVAPAHGASLKLYSYHPLRHSSPSDSFGSPLPLHLHPPFPSSSPPAASISLLSSLHLLSPPRTAQDSSLHPRDACFSHVPPPSASKSLLPYFLLATCLSTDLIGFRGVPRAPLPPLQVPEAAPPTWTLQHNFTGLRRGLPSFQAVSEPPPLSIHPKGLVYTSPYASLPPLLPRPHCPLFPATPHPPRYVFFLLFPVDISHLWLLAGRSPRETRPRKSPGGSASAVQPCSRCTKGRSAGAKGSEQRRPGQEGEHGAARHQ